MPSASPLKDSRQRKKKKNRTWRPEGRGGSFGVEERGGMDFQGHWAAGWGVPGVDRNGGKKNKENADKKE